MSVQSQRLPEKDAKEKARAAAQAEKQRQRMADPSEAERIAKEQDHYVVLGVNADATAKQLKTAYRMMSLKYHPDRPKGSTAAFQRIAGAYQTLSDPSRAAVVVKIQTLMDTRRMRRTSRLSGRRLSASISQSATSFGLSAIHSSKRGNVQRSCARSRGRKRGTKTRFEGDVRWLVLTASFGDKTP